MKKLNYGHLKSQKFAGFVFAVFVCFMSGIVQVSEASTQAVVMGVVALYTAFAGTRTMSDNAALKFGNTAANLVPDTKPAIPAPVTTKKVALTVPPAKKDEKEDVD